MTASAPTANAFLRPLGNDVGDGHVRDPAKLQPDGGAEPDGPGSEHDDLVGGAGFGAVDTVQGDRHGFVERGDVVGRRIGDNRQALAHHGDLDDQIFAHAAQCAAAANGAGRGGLRVTTTRSPTFRPVTSAPTSTISPAGLWPSGTAVIWPPGPNGPPPMCRKVTSVPQMPHARTAGARPWGREPGVRGRLPPRR